MIDNLLLKLHADSYENLRDNMIENKVVGRYGVRKVNSKIKHYVGNIPNTSR